MLYYYQYYYHHHYQHHHLHQHHHHHLDRVLSYLSVFVCVGDVVYVCQGCHVDFDDGACDVYVVYFHLYSIVNLPMCSHVRHRHLHRRQCYYLHYDDVCVCHCVLRKVFCAFLYFTV